MINISVSEPFFLRQNSISSDITQTLTNLYEMLKSERGQTPELYFKGQNKMLRAKYGCQEWLKSIRHVGLSREQILAAYHLSQTDENNTTELRNHSKKLSFSTEYTISELVGFKTPMRALMIMLWHEGHLLLPIGYDRTGAALILPTLYDLTDNFFTTIAKKSPNSNLKKHFRFVQYTVDWRSPADVSFLETWEAIPRLKKLKREISGKTTTSGILQHYTLLSWLETFVAFYPKQLSPGQFELLQEFMATTGASKYDNYAFETPEEFESYYRTSTKEKKRFQMNAQNARIRKTQRSIIYTKGSPEDNFANIIVRSRENFEWLEVDGYLSRDATETKTISAGWLPLFKSYYQYLIKRKISKGYKKQLLGPLYKLCDYLFCYIPSWISENPNSAIEQPLQIDDFLSVIFWNCIISPDSAFLEQFGAVPKPLLTLYQESCNMKASSAFVKSVYSFFEYCITYRDQLSTAGLYKIDENFTNPINLEDAPGSGPRSGTGKVVVPAFSVGILRHYTIALNKIGIDLRNNILNNNYTTDEINEIAHSEWIDLNKFGLATSFKTNDPKENRKRIEIPLLTIPNVYSWKWDNYHNALKDNELIYTNLPWLSSLRMIAIGLFAGQRLQGAQWLGLNNYRCQHHEGNS